MAISALRLWHSLYHATPDQIASKLGVTVYGLWCLLHDVVSLPEFQSRLSFNGYENEADAIPGQRCIRCGLLSDFVTCEFCQEELVSM